MVLVSLAVSQNISTPPPPTPHLLSLSFSLSGVSMATTAMQVVEERGHVGEVLSGAAVNDSG